MYNTHKRNILYVLYGLIFLGVCGLLGTLWSKQWFPLIKHIVDTVTCRLKFTWAVVCPPVSVGSTTDSDRGSRWTISSSPQPLRRALRTQPPPTSSTSSCSLERLACDIIINYSYMYSILRMWTMVYIVWCNKLVTHKSYSKRWLLWMVPLYYTVYYTPMNLFIFPTHGRHIP